MKKRLIVISLFAWIIVLFSTFSSTPVFADSSYSENIDMTVGKGIQRVYIYPSSNIEFQTSWDGVVDVNIISKQSLGSSYMYTVGYVSKKSGAQVSVRPYNPDTEEYLDLIIISVKSDTISKSTCVDHKLYIGGLSAGNSSTPQINVSGPGSNMHKYWNTGKNMHNLWGYSQRRYTQNRTYMGIDIYRRSRAELYY